MQQLQNRLNTNRKSLMQESAAIQKLGEDAETTFCEGGFPLNVKSNCNLHNLSIFYIQSL